MLSDRLRAGVALPSVTRRSCPALMRSGQWAFLALMVDTHSYMYITHGISTSSIRGHEAISIIGAFACSVEFRMGVVLSQL